MKVVALNGSPKENGNTWHALRAVCAALEENGIETEIVHIGHKAVRGCIACGSCARNQNERCVLPDDGINDCVQLLKSADGLLLGSPVYYTELSGTMKCFLDRLFYVMTHSDRNILRHKVGASVAAVRRSGGIPTIDTLNHYLMYAEMILPTSNYWPVIHGSKPGEVEQDTEGMQCLRLLGENMAWLLKLREYGKDAVPEPAPVQKVFTNFIR